MPGTRGAEGNCNAAALSQALLDGAAAAGREQTNMTASQPRVPVGGRESGLPRPAGDRLARSPGAPACLADILLT